jgi:hypothetical protein
VVRTQQKSVKYFKAKSTTQPPSTESPFSTSPYTPLHNRILLPGRSAIVHDQPLKHSRIGTKSRSFPVTVLHTQQASWRSAGWFVGPSHAPRIRECRRGATDERYCANPATVAAQSTLITLGKACQQQTVQRRDKSSWNAWQRDTSCRGP